VSPAASVSEFSLTVHLGLLPQAFVDMAHSPLELALPLEVVFLKGTSVNGAVLENCNTIIALFLVSFPETLVLSEDTIGVPCPVEDLQPVTVPNHLERFPRFFIMPVQCVNLSTKN